MKYILTFVGIIGIIFLSSLQKESEVVQEVPKIVSLEEQSEIKTTLLEAFENAYPQEMSKSGTVQEFTLTASEGKVTIIDDMQTKVWSYNGQVPGPELRIQLGDTVKINFNNQLPDETTIHFHGVRVPNAMDGVPGVTQDPIQPGDSFIYEFTPKDAGTFWFHPHVRGSEQVERGLYGTLIVENPNEPEYSQDITWVIDDWRLMQDAQIYDQFNTQHDLMHDGRWGNVITVNGSTNETLKVDAGERIRLRLVNTSNGRIYSPDFSYFDAKVIAIDGMLLSQSFIPYNIELAPGMRYDIDLTIPNRMKGKTLSILDYFPPQPYTLASIEVSENEIDTPIFESPKNNNIPEWSEALKLPIDIDYNLHAHGDHMKGIQWMVQNEADTDADTTSIAFGEVQKIRFTNYSSRYHPMHIHGQFFQVLTRNGEAVDEKYFRDTVLVHPQEVVEILMVPIDTGIWMNHCHILEHAEAGMMTKIQVK